MKKRPWMELKIAISYISSILSYGGFELEVKFTIYSMKKIKGYHF